MQWREREKRKKSKNRRHRGRLPSIDLHVRFYVLVLAQLPLYVTAAAAAAAQQRCLRKMLCYAVRGWSVPRLTVLPFLSTTVSDGRKQGKARHNTTEQNKQNKIRPMRAMTVLDWMDSTPNSTDSLSARGEPTISNEAEVGTIGSGRMAGMPVDHLPSSFACFLSVATTAFFLSEVWVTREAKTKTGR